MPGREPNTKAFILGLFLCLSMIVLILTALSGIQ